MNFGITAFTMQDENYTGHTSLYRLLPEIAADEDSVTSNLSDDDLIIKLANMGFEHMVMIENDNRLERRVTEASDYFPDLSSVEAWTGAISREEALFFFRRPTDAVTFKLTT
jgi:hypothetical protein